MCLSDTWITCCLVLLLKYQILLSRRSQKQRRVSCFLRDLGFGHRHSVFMTMEDSSLQYTETRGAPEDGPVAMTAVPISLRFALFGLQRGSERGAGRG